MRFIIYFILFLLPSICIATPINLSVNEKNGLPEINYGGRNILTSNFIFFGNNWAWANQESNFHIESPNNYIIQGKNQLLDFDLLANITKPSGHSIEWIFTLDAHSAKSKVTGGGISFKFNPNDLILQEIGQPEILEDQSGWRWGKDKKFIDLKINPKPAAIFFERGNKSELRIYFYNNSITKGTIKYKVNMTVSENININPTITEQFGANNQVKWVNDNLDWKESPVDLSFLNEPEKPAGKRGFLKATGENLVFNDGTKVRFWGTNIAAYSIFGTSNENIKIQAKRLSALGFNLVRLHHHDSPWVNPNIFGSNPRNTLVLDQNSLDKLDWWIKCLKDEGIYIWLDMHVQRALMPNDHIYGYEEISKGKDQADLKGYNYVNLTIKNLMKKFSTDYINHINRYTQIKYKDDAAIIALLITNENDITYHFGNALLPDKNVPKHSDLYMHEAEVFASANNLPKNETWRSWEFGPSKIFLNDLEERFHQDFIQELKMNGAKSLIVPTSSWGSDPLSSIPALSVGDIIDAHAYQGYGALEANPTIAPNLTNWIAAAQIVDMPLSVTEWNAEPFPTIDRHVLPMYVASRASLQGWDAMIQYAYSQAPLNSAGSPSNWDTFNDPGLITTMPASALMYRQKHITESSSVYVFTPSKEDLFYKEISPDTSVAIRTASELGKIQIAMPYVKELPWLKKSTIPKNAKLIKDFKISQISLNADEATSDSGELTRNWALGYYKINTPKTQAVMGWIGGQKFKLADVDFKITTPNATIAVQSMDGKNINQSNKLLISMSARAIPNQGNKLPFKIEPVTGSISIKAPPGMKLYKRGILKKEIEVGTKYLDGHYIIDLDKESRANGQILTLKPI